MAQVGQNKRTWASYDAVLAGILGDVGLTSLLQFKKDERKVTRLL